MALFDLGTDLNLEDVLGNQAKYQQNKISDSYVQKKRKLVGQEAAAGRLGSGVANYGLADLAAGEAGGMADVNANLAGALGQVPAESYLNKQALDRNYALARLIAELNKRSGAESGLSGAATGASAGAAFGPWGAVAGGLIGGLGGAYG